MKQYYENEDATVYQLEGLSIPAVPGNRHYREMFAEIDAGEAEIVPYAAPTVSPKEARDEALDNLVHDLGGGRIIQVRKKDEQNIRNAIELMNRHGIPAQLWLMADDTSHNVTAAELQEALESGQDQGASVWAAFFSES